MFRSIHFGKLRTNIIKFVELSHETVGSTTTKCHNQCGETITVQGTGTSNEPNLSMKYGKCIFFIHY